MLDVFYRCMRTDEIEEGLIVSDEVGRVEEQVSEQVNKNMMNSQWQVFTFLSGRHQKSRSRKELRTLIG